MEVWLCCLGMSGRFVYDMVIGNGDGDGDGTLYICWLSDGNEKLFSDGREG